MRKLLRDFWIFIILIFSFNYVFADVNNTYEKYNSLSDDNAKYGYVPDEFVSYYDITPATAFNYKRSYRSTTILPSVYDLRNVNNKRLITEVKNQGDLGLCWAFSTNSMLESYYLVNDGLYYNFSENAPDYISQYYGDSASSKSGNSFENAIKYWFLGNGPVEESIFGSYYTTAKEKDKFDFLDSSIVNVDVENVVFFKALDMQELKKERTGSEIKTIVSEYNKSIKNHIINNGALAAGIFMDYMDYNTNFLYNPNYSGSGSQGHAITIIGWDDSFGSVTINNETLKGSWIAMNSWGEGVYDYFYISYYDADVVTSFVGTTSAKDKVWDNSYFNINALDSNVDYKENSVTYIINKGKNSELIESLKIYYRHSDDIKFKISISDGINKYDFAERTYSKGLYTFNLDNSYLDTDKIYITLTGEDILSYYPYVYSGVFTHDYSDESLELYGKESNSFLNNTSNILYFNVISKNINTASEYSVSVYDEYNNDITSSFNVEVIKELINGHSSFKIQLKKKIDTKKISVKVIWNYLYDEINYYIDGKGTVNNPYIIENSNDMELLLNHQDAYFILGNNIDMYLPTASVYGNYYNGGNGWNSSDFSGYLDGRGYTISGLYSNSSGLFNNVNDASISDIHFDNFNVESSNDSGVIGFNINDGNVNNVYISNSTINGETSSGILFGTISGGNLQNIHLESNTVFSLLNVGGLSGIIDSLSDISISNIFFDEGTILTNDGNIGYISGKCSINDNTVSIKNNRWNVIENKKYKNPSEIISEKKYDESKINLDDNKILNDSEILEKNNFENFDLENVWIFNNKNMMLRKFTEPVFDMDSSSNVSEYGIYFKNYKLNDTLLYNIYPKTILNSFDKNVVVKGNVTYDIYNSNDKKMNESDYITTGSYIIVNSDNDSKKYIISVYGDVSGDGKSTIKDVYLISDYIIANSGDKNKILSNTAKIKAADVNNDGKISISDVFKIADYVINPSKGF